MTLAANCDQDNSDSAQRCGLCYRTACLLFQAKDIEVSSSTWEWFPLPYYQRRARVCRMCAGASAIFAQPPHVAEWAVDEQRWQCQPGGQKRAGRAAVTAPGSLLKICDPKACGSPAHPWHAAWTLYNAVHSLALHRVHGASGRLAHPALQRSSSCLSIQEASIPRKAPMI